MLLRDSVELHSTRMRLSCTHEELWFCRSKLPLLQLLLLELYKQKYYWKKKTLTPNLNSTGTWKGNVDCQLLGKLGSVKCWISQDQVNFTAFFKYFTNTKAILPEIKPPLEENSNKSSKIFINLTSKQILLNLKGLSRQQGIIQHTSVMSTGTKYRKLKSSVLSWALATSLVTAIKENINVYFSYLFLFNYQENLSSIVASS